ncbi:MAG: hypothetical protein KGR70_08245, partial [Cyanobacteria bacterium REEB494]|nr:hypothetical protein [Cyanobacteria bacterium REEB494]
ELTLTWRLSVGETGNSLSQSLSRLKTDWFCSESLWVTHSTNNCASLQRIAIAREYQILVSGIKYKTQISIVRVLCPRDNSQLPLKKIPWGCNRR